MIECDLRSEMLLRLQREQFQHDKRNHSDILCLHKTERLKHYGLHFCKYVGRLARGRDGPKNISETIVDAVLVNLSAANTLHQHLQLSPSQYSGYGNDIFLAFADAAGRFADACEKIDHLESFLQIALVANIDITNSIFGLADIHQVELSSRIVERRIELSHRHFYIDEE